MLTLSARLLVTAPPILFPSTMAHILTASLARPDIFNNEHDKGTGRRRKGKLSTTPPETDQLTLLTMEDTIQRQSSKPASKSSKNPPSSKLRASCDGCSLAKVKCDKKQSSCHRCAKSGIACNYSPSMRMGKTSAANRAAAAKGLELKHRSSLSVAASTRASSPSSTSSANSSVRNPGFVDQHLTSPIYPRTPEFGNLISKSCQVSVNTEDLPTGYLTDWNQYSRRFYNDDMLATQTGVLPPDPLSFSHRSNSLHSTAASTEPIFTRDDDMQPYFHSADQESMSVDFNSPTVHLASPVSSVPDVYNHDCMNLAMNTLNSLNLPPSTTDTSTYPSLPTIDQALTTNKGAIESLFVLLGCPCPHDPHLPFLVAVITSKVLAWYQAVARASATTPTIPRSRFANTETAVHMPLTLGAYPLDGDYEARMKVQLVLGELRTVELLVEKFGERFCRGVEDGVYAALETFLRSRLRETVLELRQG